MPRGSCYSLQCAVEAINKGHPQFRKRKALPLATINYPLSAAHMPTGLRRWHHSSNPAGLVLGYGVLVGRDAGPGPFYRFFGTHSLNEVSTGAARSSSLPLGGCVPKFPSTCQDLGRFNLPLTYPHTGAGADTLGQPGQSGQSGPKQPGSPYAIERCGFLRPGRYAEWQIRSRLYRPGALPAAPLVQWTNPWNWFLG
jgi:hypothetical protein